jgi:hypothetical protein
MWRDAMAETQRVLPELGPGGAALMGYLLARAGRTVEAHQILRDFLDRSQRRGDVAGEIATVYAGLGDRERTALWLERARHERTLVLEELPTILRSLRQDPRNQLIRSQLGLTGE